METNIIRIGNSRGVILPAGLLKQMGLTEGNTVTLTLDGDTLLMRATQLSANLLRTRFYVRPVCGNIVHSASDATVTCHGINLHALTARPMDDPQAVTLERVEDEAYIAIRHPMTKSDYITFIAAVAADRVQLVRLYPEGNAGTRFNPRGVRAIYYYSTTGGLFKLGTALLAALYHQGV